MRLRRVPEIYTAFVALAACVAACATVPVLLAPLASAEPVTVTASPLPLFPNHPEEKRAGKLVYRGGLRLNSSDVRFAGLSDLAVSADGRNILAVSDNAYWFRAELRYDDRGDLAGIANAQMASMRDLEGNLLKGKEGDAEGLTSEIPGTLEGAVFVSFEGNGRIWRYDLSKGLSAVPTNVAVGEWVRALPSNGGMEALARLPSGDLLALSEYGASPGGGFIGALEGSSTRTLSVVERAPFQVTSAAIDGTRMFLLERRFSMIGGAGTEIRQLPVDAIRPGSRLEGDVILDLSAHDANIDNMEGIAVRKGPRGETLLYLISDDNGSALQRTLLLMFEIQ